MKPMFWEVYYHIHTPPVNYIRPLPWRYVVVSWDSLSLEFPWNWNWLL